MDLIRHLGLFSSLSHAHIKPCISHFLLSFPHVLIVRFLTYFLRRASSLLPGIKHFFLCFFGLNYGQINEPRKSALKNPWVITITHREFMSQKQKKKSVSGRKQAIEYPGTKKQKHDRNMLHVRRDEAERFAGGQKIRSESWPRSGSWWVHRRGVGRNFSKLKRDLTIQF